MITRNVIIDKRVHCSLSESAVYNFKKIMDRFKVDLRYSDEPDEKCIVLITGLKENVSEAKSHLLDLKMQQITVDHRAHSCLIGTRGCNINQIMDQFNVDVRFPSETDKNPDAVLITGVEENILVAKDHLLKLEKEYIPVTMEVEPKYHAVIIGRKGVVITKIINENQVQIQFPSARSKNKSLIAIIGSEENSKAAREDIFKIVRECVDKTTKEITVDRGLHSKLIGKGGRNIKTIMDRFKVKVQFPKENDGHPDTVAITGQEKNVFNAINHIIQFLEGFDNNQVIKIKVFPEHQKSLIGHHGVDIRKIRHKYGVRIIFPSDQDEDKETVLIIGKKESVDEIKFELEALLKNFESMVTQEVHIHADIHSRFTKPKSQISKRIMDQFDVDLGLASDAQSYAVLITGLEGNVLKAKDYLSNLVIREIIIDRRVHPKVIGSRGHVICKIMDQFNVYLELPPDESGKTNTVVIMGPEENVIDANDHLLDIEEKFFLSNHTVEMKVRPELHANLISLKSGKEKAKIVFPSDRDEDKEIILITGNKRSVLRVKSEVEIILKNLKNAITQEITIDSGLYSTLMKSRIQNIKKIMEDFEVDIRPASNTDVNPDSVIIIGQEDNVKKAKNHLHNLTSKEIPIDRQLRSKLIGCHHHNCDIMKGIDKCKVDLGFPIDIDGNSNTVLVTGTEENIARVKCYLLSLTSQEIAIDCRIISKLIGSKSGNIRKLVGNLKVHVEFPQRTNGNLGTAVITGQEQEVLHAKNQLLNLVGEEVTVDGEIISNLKASKNHYIAAIMYMFKVYIDFPSDIDPNPETVVVTGLEDNVLNVECYLQNLVSHEINMDSGVIYKLIDPIGSKVGKIIHECTNFKIGLGVNSESTGNIDAVVLTGLEENVAEAKDQLLNLKSQKITMDYKVISKVNGSKSFNVKKIMNTLKVDLEFPQNNDRDPNSVIIIGLENNVLDARDQLLKLKCQKIAINCEVLSKLIGTKTRKIRKIMDKCNVDLELESDSDGNCDAVVITGLAENVSKAKELLLDTKSQIITVDSNIILKVIGSKNVSMKKMSNKFKVDLEFKHSSNGNPSTAIIIGQQKNVLDVRDLLLALKSQEIIINCKVLSKLIRTESQKILKMMNKFAVDFEFQSNTVRNCSAVVITGLEKNVLEAKEQLLNMKGLEITVDSTVLSKVIASKKVNIQKMADKLKVDLEFLQCSSENLSTVTIIGQEENVLEARDKLLDLKSQEIVISSQVLSQLIGIKACKIRKILNNFEVDSEFQADAVGNCSAVVLTGLEKNVLAAKKQLLNVKILEISVDSNILSKEIASKKGSLKKMKSKFLVDLELKLGIGGNSFVVLIGVERSTFRAKRYLLKLLNKHTNVNSALGLHGSDQNPNGKKNRDSISITKLGKDVLNAKDGNIKTEKIMIDSRVIYKLLRSKARNIKQIKSKLKVDLEFMSNTDEDANFVIITGLEKDVLYARNQLLKVRSQEIILDCIVPNKLNRLRNHQLQQIRTKLGLKVDLKLPSSTVENPNAVVITGLEDDVLNAKERMLGLKSQKYTDDCKVLSKLVESGTCDIVQIKNQFKVDMEFFSESGEVPSSLFIIGPEKNVSDAKDYLLNMTIHEDQSQERNELV